MRTLLFYAIFLRFAPKSVIRKNKIHLGATYWLHDFGWVILGQ